MNPAHLHLMLNHIPVLGMAFGLALVSLALLRKSEELKRISLGFLIVIALLAIPAYLTGEPAEELVENLPGVSKSSIEQHEEAARDEATFGKISIGSTTRSDQFIPAPVTPEIEALPTPRLQIAQTNSFLAWRECLLMPKPSASARNCRGG